MRGGVRLDDNSSFTMRGGTICQNEANYGGGVYVTDSGNFIMAGGTISENTASDSGGGAALD
ncbi:MAG: hypothetical protein LBH06_07625, partial [Rikenellaceae bacterium]|nr:hypothetical protein [Rikenellaceae bacterium]